MEKRNNDSFLLLQTSSELRNTSGSVDAFIKRASKASTQLASHDVFCTSSRNIYVVTRPETGQLLPCCKQGNFFLCNSRRQSNICGGQKYFIADLKTNDTSSTLKILIGIYHWSIQMPFM